MINSHLHFDHAGCNTFVGESGRCNSLSRTRHTIVAAASTTRNATPMSEQRPATSSAIHAVEAAAKFELVAREKTI